MKKIVGMVGLLALCGCGGNGYYVEYDEPVGPYYYDNGYYDNYYYHNHY
ncbi:MAG: hypothetical protein JSS09_01060, partial [Verrucomicrobia bacterium]|nr:hypothetical protein [Verrucomicrobiota bacterium]